MQCVLVKKVEKIISTFVGYKGLRHACSAPQKLTARLLTTQMSVNCCHVKLAVSTNMSQKGFILL